MRLHLETVLTGRGYADLAASSLQLAIVRAADGRPQADALDDAGLVAHFGTAELPDQPPAVVVVVAGVRGGKTLLSACAAIKSALTADLRALKKHEVARFAIVAPTVDNASAGYTMVRGIVSASPVLRRMVVGEPTADTLTLRRTDGRVVEIVVVAAARGAVTLRSRWLVGFALDEVAGFGAESTGAAVHAEDLLRAGETRLVPGGQGWLISSPFGPQGLLYDLWRAHFGKPGRVLVIHAPTRAMNPTFPVEQIEAIRRRDPDAAAREYDAAWIDPVCALLDGRSLDAATRREPLERPRDHRFRYVAAMDPATRGNSWCLAVGHNEPAESGARVVVDGAWQWTGSKSQPLSPSSVLAEIARIVDRYGVRIVLTDQWSNDALKDIARGVKLTLDERTSNAESKIEGYDAIKTLLAEKRLELPPVPMLRQDLAGVRRRILANGMRIELTRTADGRHCDYAPTVELLVSAAPNAALPILKPTQLNNPRPGAYRLSGRGFG